MDRSADLQSCATEDVVKWVRCWSRDSQHELHRNSSVVGDELVALRMLRLFQSSQMLEPQVLNHDSLYFKWYAKEFETSNGSTSAGAWSEVSVLEIASAGRGSCRDSSLMKPPKKSPMKPESGQF